MFIVGRFFCIISYLLLSFNGDGYMAKSKKQQIIKTKCSQCNGTGELTRKKINGKKKGNRGELKVCKILTEKLGIGKFNRVPSSGAFGSTHVLSTEAQLCLSGDLIAPTPDFAFSIENKCGYNDIELGKILMEKSQLKQLGEFLEQSCDDAERTKRIPMVIYTKDYRDPVAVIPVVNHEKIKEVELLKEKVKVHLCFECEIEKYPKWNKWVIFTLNEMIDKSDKNFFIIESKNGDNT